MRGEMVRVLGSRVSLALRLEESLRDQRLLHAYADGTVRRRFQDVFKTCSSWPR